MFLLGASDTYPVKSTGGSTTVIIGKANLPNVTLSVYTQYAKRTHGEDYDVVNLRDSHSEVDGEFSRTGKTDPLGNGTPLNILPPYYAVNIWRRVA